MGKRHSEVERQAIVNRFLIDNESVADIVTETGIARSTIYGWISQSREIKAPKNIELTVKDYRKLESRVKRLESIIEVIKESGCSPSNTLDVKLPAMELLQGRYSIHLLCDALDVPRGTFYNYVFRGKHTHTWYAERREMM
ncbi:MAG: transposase, partial [Clostridia bacterium]|nr:transposase [Clostridia bacterium]